MKKFIPIAVCLFFIQSIISLSLVNAQTQTESEKLNAYFEKVYMERRDMYPEWQGYMGVKDRNDEWNDDSDEMWDREFDLQVESLQYIKDNFDYEQLYQISYKKLHLIIIFDCG